MNRRSATLAAFFIGFVWAMNGGDANASVFTKPFDCSASFREPGARTAEDARSEGMVRADAAARAPQKAKASRRSVSPQTTKAYRHVPEQQPKFIEKCNPVFWFGNLDDPEPPDWYLPDQKGRTARWYGRNSLHNFTHYVIGISDKEFVRVGRFPADNLNPNDGWNWAVCKYKCVRLPFISYQKRRFKFYCGWRKGGNFGLKLNFNARK